MTVLVDARPQGLNLLFRPDTTLTLEMTWPAGELVGRTFSSTLGDQTLAVTVDGDVMTVEASAAQTELFEEGVKVDWALLEDLGGDEPEPLLVGKWMPSIRAGEARSAVSVITDGAITVEVAVYSGGLTTAALNTHAASKLDGVHGVVELDWTQDGTTPLTRTVMTQDGSNSFTTAVTSGQLVFTATGSGDGQHEAWRIANTNWADSEMVSMLGRSDSFGAPPNAAQWWHLHRVRYDSGAGLWRAVAVWTDIVFTVIPILNLGFVTFDGASSLLLNTVNLVGDWAGMIRDFPILRAQRTSNVSTYWTNVPWLDSLTTSDSGAVTGMAVAGFNQTTTAVTAVDRSRRTFSLANTGANATDADAGGVFQLAAPKNQVPMMLASRVVGNTVQAKRWRPEEAEPDWSDPTHAITQTFSGGSPAPHSGVGDCAIGAAHLQSPNKQRFGRVRCRRL